MDLELEIAHFHEGDANKDGFHSKKEFYYAIMKEEYENFAEKHGVSVADLEFEAEDLDGDGKISLEEWVAVFFHEDPQTPQYVDGEEVDEVMHTSRHAFPKSDGSFHAAFSCSL
eukprot:3006540-Rhodomonas_salina.3